MNVDVISDRIIAFFCSLRLTVVCLALGLVLVFLGTMAQEPLGLYLSQAEFFRSFFVPAPAVVAAVKKALQMVYIYLPPSTAAEVMTGSRIPLLPGGYLIGGLLVINLVASACKRLKFTRAKTGIWMVHFGLILLLVGQLMTDLLARESSLHLREGETKNYSENDREVELVLVDTTDKDSDRVVAVAEDRLRTASSLQLPEIPFTIKVNRWLRNCRIVNRPPNTTEPAPATHGVGPDASLTELPRVTEMGKRDIPAAVVEILTPQGSLGTWLISEFVGKPQAFTLNNRKYEIALRPRRHYKPFSLQLLEFKHDIYPGTDIPKNFSSRVLLEQPQSGEKREVLIYMNKPLRYAGETFYQASYDQDNRGTILQVVRNPSWLTPYFSCVLVGAGLMVHFMMHLLGFSFKRRTA